MSEGGKEPGRRGRRPEAGPAGSFPEPGKGGSTSLIGWIVSANVVALLALGVAVAALVFYITEEDGEGGAPAVAQPTATPTVTPAVQPTPTPIVVENVSVDDDPSWGPEDAPVTIIEFSEFLCPYCQRFALQTLPQIKQAYEGKVRYVYRDFIVHGAPATKIAEAAECADDQEKFWEYHDLLWENFQALQQQAADIEGLSASLKTYAADLGLDTATFNDCLDTAKNTAEVQKDSQDAQTYGVQGTPGFFVNGRVVRGAIPFEDYQGSTGATQPGFKSIIDEALAAAESGSALPTVPSTGG